MKANKFYTKTGQGFQTISLKHRITSEDIYCLVALHITEQYAYTSRYSAPEDKTLEQILAPTIDDLTTLEVDSIVRDNYYAYGIYCTERAGYMLGDTGWEYGTAENPDALRTRLAEMFPSFFVDHREGR